LRVLEQQASLTPDAVAFIEPARSVTVREIAHGSNRLARYLIDEGVEPGTIVGVAVIARRRPSWRCSRS
jgi:non-ribosomal peptide synthetase component F